MKKLRIIIALIVLSFALLPLPVKAQGLQCAYLYHIQTLDPESGCITFVAWYDCERLGIIEVEWYECY